MARPTSKYRCILITFFLLSSLFALAIARQTQQQQQEQSPSTPASSAPLSNQTKKRRAGNLIRQFLGEHNKVRTTLGEEPLEWDRTLARYARRWGSKRAADCKLMHSGNPPPYGENIYWGQNYHKHSISDAVRKWADEIDKYDPVTNTCSEPEACGHYTQLVWRSTLRLGCERVKCKNGGVFITCNYDPPGNYPGENPFGSEIPPQLMKNSTSQSPETPTTPSTTPTTPSTTPTSPETPPASETTLSPTPGIHIPGFPTIPLPKIPSLAVFGGVHRFGG